MVTKGQAGNKKQAEVRAAETYLKKLKAAE
jgi:hypothetical protein